MNTKKVERKQNRVKAILISIGLILLIAVATAIASAENRKVISVCWVRAGSAISANALITEDMLEEHEMYYKEFKNAGVQTLSDGTTRQCIVTWDKRDQVINTRYSAYYIRANTPLYWDSTVKEQSKRNSYLYNMKGELVNIQMDTSDFGDMVVPGDKINVRVSYEEAVYDLPTEEQYMLSGNNAGSATKQVNEKLFSETPILDMLNSKGNSIFDIYYDFISKGKAEQAKLLQNEDFIASIKPVTILLEVTAEEADNYMNISSKSPEYLMTLLPRTSSNAILDSLSDIMKVVNSNNTANK